MAEIFTLITLGTCMIVPILFVMFIITLFKPKYGAFFLRNGDNKLNKRNGLIIWSILILIFSLINGFAFGYTGGGTLYDGLNFGISFVTLSIFIILCVIAVYYIGVFAYNFYKALPTKPKNDNNMNELSKPKIVQQPKKPIYDTNKLLQQLLYGQNQVKLNAAITLKEVNQPLLPQILQNCLIEYRKYQNSIRTYNSQIQLTPYGNAS